MEAVPAGNTSYQRYLWSLRGMDDLILREYVARGSVTQHFALRDLWNIAAITDNTGAVQERYAYDAFGTTLYMNAGFGAIAASAYGWQVTFCGYLLDTETGFYQVRYRYLHPALGKWLSRDPIASSPPYLGLNPSRLGPHMRIGEMTVGSNLYEYVDNDPTGKVDPLGKDATAIGAEAGSFAGPEGTIIGGLIGFGIDTAVTYGLADALWHLCHHHKDVDCSQVRQQCISECSDNLPSKTLGGGEFRRCVRDCMEAQGCSF